MHPIRSCLASFGAFRGQFYDRYYDRNYDPEAGQSYDRGEGFRPCSTNCLRGESPLT